MKPRKGELIVGFKQHLYPAKWEASNGVITFRFAKPVGASRTHTAVYAKWKPGLQYELANQVVWEALNGIRENNKEKR